MSPSSVSLGAVRIWDALTDPVVGHLGDRTRSRLGRRPWCRCLRACMAALALAACAVASVRAEPLLWQTSSEGDDIQVFDLESRKLVRRIVVGPEPHGIAAPADARVVYVALEANGRARGELLWIDPREYRVEHRMEICREPHALAATPDGRWLYVPCRDEHYWVVDAEERKVVDRIHTGGRPRAPALPRSRDPTRSARDLVGVRSVGDDPRHHGLLLS